MAKKRKFSDLLLKIAALMMAIILLPTTVMLAIGLLPTIVVYFVLRRSRMRTITIGAMNLAGCMPFVFTLWMGGHDFKDAMEIILNPETIIIIYACAGVGYVIDWAVTGIVAAMMYERGKARQKDVQKHLEKMIERWGDKVTGVYQLDSYGFPLEGSVKDNSKPKHEDDEEEDD